MRIKSTTAFRVYADARAKSATEQAAATARFMVKSVNKDGSISRMAPTRNDWKYDAFATAEDAERRRAQLEAMNPEGHQLPRREGRAAQARRRDRAGDARERALVREHRGLQRERARSPRARRRDARRGRARDGAHHEPARRHSTPSATPARRAGLRARGGRTQLLRSCRSLRGLLFVSTRRTAA